MNAIVTKALVGVTKIKAIRHRSRYFVLIGQVCLMQSLKSSPKRSELQNWSLNVGLIRLPLSVKYFVDSAVLIAHCVAVGASSFIHTKVTRSIKTWQLSFIHVLEKDTAAKNKLLQQPFLAHEANKNFINKKVKSTYKALTKSKTERLTKSN